MKPFSGTANDSCPAWAKDLIVELLQLEIQLGNVPDATEWSEEIAEKLLRNAEDNNSANEAKTAKIFTKIVVGLRRENFSNQDIAKFVNCRIGYSGGPAYCSEAEVEDAFQDGTKN